MSAYRVIRRAATGDVLVERAHWCTSFWCRFRGLMLRRHLGTGAALVLVYGHESVAETTIHMLFMRFPIGVIWMDAEQRVVDAKLAKPWRPWYAPRAPARYVVESRPEVLERVTVGDRLLFENVPAGRAN